MTSVSSADGFARGNSYMSPGGATLPRKLSRILALEDFEKAARKHLPRPVFGYIAGAAENNLSLRVNRESFDANLFKTRVLVDVSRRSQQVNLFGSEYSSPFGIAPMGLGALSAYRCDIVQASAARLANIPMVLSGSSLIRLEEVIAKAPDTWFQAYLPGDINRIDALIDRVAAAGYRVLVITVDLPVAGNRENNIRSGFSTPLRPSFRLVLDGVAHPSWLLGTFIRTLWHHGMPHFENSFAERGAPILSTHVLRDFSARDHFSWDHVAHIRKRWGGTLVLKGILSAHDARIAQARGADGIIVSNHGGRQLDGAAAPLRVLPEVVDAAGTMPVMLDGGIRRGTDVLKAIALGAKFVFVGRPFAYAAAVAGERGVLHAIALLRDEIDRNMAMLGVPAVDRLGPDALVPQYPAGW